MKSKASTRVTKVVAPVTPAPAACRPPPTRDQIQALAHALWMDRGCPQGCDVEIWLAAERQLGGLVEPLADPGRVDVDTSEAAERDRELDRMVAPREQRSPTSL
jgi:hypothetical protein